MIKKQIKDCTYKEFIANEDVNKDDKFYRDIKLALDGSLKYVQSKIADQNTQEQVMEEAFKGILKALDIAFSLNKINIKE